VTALLLLKMSSFPKGRCCAGGVVPTHELHHHCAGCKRHVHLLCSHAIVEEVLHFKEDDFVCKGCDPEIPHGVAAVTVGGSRGTSRERQVSSSKSNASSSKEKAPPSKPISSSKEKAPPSKLFESTRKVTIK
jgi:hypothetical protein